MEESITIEEVKDLTAKGFNCAQIVFSYGAEKMGMDREIANKIAAAFGMGMFNGETCGCVTGALMALGLKYGANLPNDLDAKGLTAYKKDEFEERFKEAHETLICKEILGLDFSNPHDRAKIIKEGMIENSCVYLMLDVCQLLDDLL